MLNFTVLVLLIACCAVNRQALLFVAAHVVSGWIISVLPHRILIPSIDWLNVSSFELSGAVFGSTLLLLVYASICFSCAKRNLAIASFVLASIYFIDAILNQLHFAKTIDYTTTFIFSEFSPYIFGVGMNFTGWQCIMLAIDSYIIYLLIANERRDAIHLFNSCVNSAGGLFRVKLKSPSNSVIHMLSSSKAIIHKNKNHIEKNS